MNHLSTWRLLAALGLALLFASCANEPKAVKAVSVPAATPPVAAGPLQAPGRFADNPIVYFTITDRFENGNPSNDASYGRKREKLPQDDVGTFHGGDLKGITNKLREGWFKDLGVNAIWITAPYEQIHGWVVGGNKEFKHYAYHGYYALDYTVLDKNMGTPEELREMVDTAHAQGIRILFDVVLNHPGYLDIQSALDLKLKVLWPNAQNARLSDYHSYIDYNNFNFGQWWGRDWVRAGLPGYIDGGRDDLTMQLAYLPDFRTESLDAVKLPPFMRPGQGKPDTRAVELPNTTVRGYLINWLTDWVREYGIDGFRADTVKHVEPAAWAELKAAARVALADWKSRHPTQKVDDEPFWMVGEYWGKGPERTALHASGFDALLNFEFQNEGAQFSRPEALFTRYSQLLSGRPGYSTLSYLSSHDTELFDRSKLEEAGAALLLAPGGVQIYYGDETARPAGPRPNSDPQQATRSDMNWSSIDQKLLDHWRKFGSFRSRHVALARGVHQQIGDTPYAFSRIDADSGDRVVVAMNAAGAQEIPVTGVFTEGERLRDAYSGQALEVRNGRVRLLNAQRWVLIERAPT